MIKIENVETYGWEAAIRGMRNPMNSWDRSDSFYPTGTPIIGQADQDLMMRLAKAGTEHAKYLRMVGCTMDVVAPDYWFKEFSTYRVGVTENSTSTMHRIHSKEFALDDFSHDHLDPWGLSQLERTIAVLNDHRVAYLEHREKIHWYTMIQLLPMSYNYRRTISLNYQVLANIYRQRKNHKLDEWHVFCAMIEQLPYSELITGGDV